MGIFWLKMRFLLVLSRFLGKIVNVVYSIWYLVKMYIGIKKRRRKSSQKVKFMP